MRLKVRHARFIEDFLCRFPVCLLPIDFEVHVKRHLYHPAFKFVTLRDEDQVVRMVSLASCCSRFHSRRY